jgi:Zn-dependent protease
MDLNETLRLLPVSIIPLIFALTVPIGAQAFVAYYFGDRHPETLDRKTFDPIKHIDMFGTLLFPIMCMVLGSPLLFGWAKPLGIHASSLRYPTLAVRYLALVIPLSNLIMAVLWLLLYRFIPFLSDEFAKALSTMCFRGMYINITLMVFSLLPLPPFPGGLLLMSFLPYEKARRFAEIERYTFWIILALIFTGLLPRLIFPLVKGMMYLLMMFV